MRRLPIPCTLIALLLSQPLLAQRSLANPDQITAAQLKAYLTFVASDEMEGRNTPSRGLDTTALFIATLLTRWGATPAGDNGTYFQKISLAQNAVDPTNTRLEIAGHSLKYGEEFFTEIGASMVTAPLVYCGDGWLLKSKNIDAFRGIDPKGKVVVVSCPNGFNLYGYTLPQGVSNQDLKGQVGVDWASPDQYAARVGATALIYILPDSVDWAQIREAGTRDRLYPEKFRTPQAQVRMPICFITQSASAALFHGEKFERGDIDRSVAAKQPVAAFELDPAKKVTLNVATTINRKTTQNVVAKFEGSDPALKNEYVAFGAHYDHLGLASTPINGDNVYNGADDDGSGTVTLMSMAEALSKAPRRPKRSTLFVWHCGEEKGLWGSQYFTSYPTIPLSQIVTQLNIDMIGRSKPEGDTQPADRELSGPNEIYVIGSKMMSSELGDLSDRVNASYLRLNFNFRYDDPRDPNRFFFRSDHFNYAHKGIPIIFYFDGVHVDYHQLSDEVSKIDFQKMEKIARTVYETMWEISGLNQRPVVDRKLPGGL